MRALRPISCPQAVQKDFSGGMSHPRLCLRPNSALRCGVSLLHDGPAHSCGVVQPARQPAVLRLHMRGSLGMPPSSPCPRRSSPPTSSNSSSPCPPPSSSPCPLPSSSLQPCRSKLHLPRLPRHGGRPRGAALFAPPPAVRTRQLVGVPQTLPAFLPRRHHVKAQACCASWSGVAVLPPPPVCSCCATTSGAHNMQKPADTWGLSVHRTTFGHFCRSACLPFGTILDPCTLN